jgi:hypothetical protein
MEAEEDLAAETRVGDKLERRRQTAEHHRGDSVQRGESAVGIANEGQCVVERPKRKRQHTVLQRMRTRESVVGRPSGGKRSRGVADERHRRGGEKQKQNVVLQAQRSRDDRPFGMRHG